MRVLLALSTLLDVLTEHHSEMEKWSDERKSWQEEKKSSQEILDKSLVKVEEYEVRVYRINCISSLVTVQCCCQSLPYLVAGLR